MYNELGERDKLQSFTSILSLFREEFNNFNTTGERMLDYIYQLKLELL